MSLSYTHSCLITFCGVAVCNYRRSGYEGPCVGKVEKGKAKGGHGAQTGGLWGKAGGAYNASDSSVAIAAGASPCVGAMGRLRCVPISADRCGRAEILSILQGEGISCRSSGRSMD